MGSSIYYLLKFISSSVLIGFVGSMVGTEGIKRATLLSKSENFAVVMNELWQQLIFFFLA